MKKYPSNLIRSFILFYLLILSATKSFSQLSNNWIKYGQQYVKVGVQKRGIYKVSYEMLREHGLAINNANKANIQLFHKGKEVNLIDLGAEYIGFYGQPNDGSSDSLLFRPTSARMNPYHSLFSDEGYYFFTIGNSSGKKLTQLSTPSVPQNKINWHWAESLQTFPEEYTHYIYGVELPSLLQSYFTNEETFASKPKSGISNDQHSIPLNNFSPQENALPELTIMVNGRTNGSNKINLKANGDLLTTLEFSGIRGVTHKSSLKKLSAGQKQVDVLLESTLSNGRYALTYIKLNYPQLLSNLTSKQEFFQFTPSSDISQVEFNRSTSTEDNYLVFDISDAANLVAPQIVTSNATKIAFPIRKNKTKTEIIIAPLKDIYEVNSISSVSFEKTAPSEINFLIITNSYLKDAAQRYSEYRASNQGGSFKTHVADIEDVYNEFNYGEPSPLAIREYVKYLLSDKNWNKYLLLLGQTTSVESRLKKNLIGVADNNPSYSTYRQIPTIGYPGSDVLLVDGLDSLQKENVPGIPVGRVAAMDPEEVIAYLDKVIEYESSLQQAWKKNVLHISGGNSINEISSFKNILSQFESVIANSSLGGRVTALAKPNLNPTQKVNISPLVNEGVGMISYFGHGNAIITDYDIGYASPTQNQINNKGKYPFMYFNGCGVGNIFSGRYAAELGLGFSRAISTDWLLAKNKGAVAILANSHDSYTSTSTKYLQSFYKLLYSLGDSLSIGQIQKLTAYEITKQTTSLFDIANLHQSVLQGDPSLKLFTISLPDYTTGDTESLVISSVNGGSIDNSSQLAFQFPIKNLGKFTKNESLPLKISFHYNDQSVLEKSLILNSISYSDTVNLTIDNIKPLESIVISIDPENNIQESDKSNNVHTLMVMWDEIKHLQSFKPEVYRDIIAPVLRVKSNNNLVGSHTILGPILEFTIELNDNQSLSTNDNDIDIYIKTTDQQSFQKLDLVLSNLVVEGKRATGKLILDKLPSGSYDLLVIGQDKSGNKSLPYQTTFRINDADDIIKLVVGPNPASSYVKFTLKNSVTMQKTSFSIYNSNGTLIEQREIILNEHNDWYWIPKVSGLYIYKVIIDGQTLTGKVLVNK